MFIILAAATAVVVVVLVELVAFPVVVAHCTTDMVNVTLGVTESEA